MNERVVVEATIQVAPNVPEFPPASFTIETSGSLGFNFQATQSFVGGDNVVTLTSTDGLESRIQFFPPSINWKVSHNGRACLQRDAGPKLVYVTVGTPRDTTVLKHQVTQIRMERAVVQAGAANSLNPHEIVKTVIQAQGAFDLTQARDNAWRVPDLGGDCQSIVRFAEKVAKMVNVSGLFDHRHIYAIETAPTVAIEVPNTHGGLNDDERNHPTESWTLALIDDDNCCNAFEAVAKFTACGFTRYYAGGTTKVFGNKDDVLTVFAELSWSSGGVGCACVVEDTVVAYPPPPANPPIPPCP